MMIHCCPSRGRRGCVLAQAYLIPLFTLTGLAATFAGETSSVAIPGFYWATIETAPGAMDGAIYASNLDGTNIRVVVPTGIRFVDTIDFDEIAGKIYWGDINAASISRANLDGTNIEVVISGTSPLIDNPGGLAIHPSQPLMFWSDFALGSNNGVFLLDLELGGLTTVVSLPFKKPRGIAIDPFASHLYWTDFIEDKIRRSDFAGTNIVDIIASTSNPRDMALDMVHKKLYWIESSGTAGIFSANLDGSDPQQVVFPNGQTIALDVAANKIHWVSVRVPGCIAAADLDGSNIVEQFVCNQVGGPGAFAVLPDCNANGVGDSADIAGGFSEDCNQNLVPDGCEFGDVDHDGSIAIDDFSFFRECMNGPIDEEQGMERLPCCGVADMNLDRAIDLRDFAEIQVKFIVQ